eukprot:jgi/Psemu1/36997/gm1.36997_g
MARGRKWKGSVGGGARIEEWIKEITDERKKGNKDRPAEKTVEIINRGKDQRNVLQRKKISLEEGPKDCSRMDSVQGMTKGSFENGSRKDDLTEERTEGTFVGEIRRRGVNAKDARRRINRKVVKY